MSKDGVEESAPPPGFFAATAGIASSLAAGADEKIPSSERVAHGTAGQESSGSPVERHVSAESSSEPDAASKDAAGPLDKAAKEAAASSDETASLEVATDDAGLYRPFDNGYHFPPKYSSGESFRHAMVGFWNYFTTTLGFLVVLYGLNVVAWGGMIFLLLCNAAPAMCYPSCNDINSPRRKWIEWDSQILNSLFCVTGFGLAPWRLRDWYYLLKFRILHDHTALRRLAGFHRSWFRLQGSQDLPLDVGPCSHTP